MGGSDAWKGWGRQEVGVTDKWELHLLHVCWVSQLHTSSLFLILIFKWNFKFFIWEEKERSNAGNFIFPVIHPLFKHNFLGLLSVLISSPFPSLPSDSPFLGQWGFQKGIVVWQCQCCLLTHVQRLLEVWALLLCLLELYLLNPTQGFITTYIFWGFLCLWTWQYLSVLGQTMLNLAIYKMSHGLYLLSSFQRHTFVSSHIRSGIELAILNLWRSRPAPFEQRQTSLPSDYTWHMSQPLANVIKSGSYMFYWHKSLILKVVLSHFIQSPALERCFIASAFVKLRCL